MHRALLLLPLLLLLETAPVAAAASGGASPAGWDDARFMPLDEVKPGMKGIGRSVFRGTGIEEFEVEILGVLPTAFPGGDMILARLSGQDLEKTGVIAGMSGSPISIDGRIIGALAFGWSFTTEPITGITPIAEMLRIAQRPEGEFEGAGGAGRSGTGGDGEGMSPQTWTRLWDARGVEVLELLHAEGQAPTSGLAPLRAPVLLGGLGESAGVQASRWAEGLGLIPVQGGAMGRDESAVMANLEPGSAVAVELVRGDAQIAAVGTVTWVDGDRVFAFGHPFLGRGGSSLPMATASIVTVMPRSSSSFKMGAVGREVGAMTRDYRPGVMGTLGESARMIPMTLNLDLDGHPQRLEFEIANAFGLTPSLAGVLASNGMDALGRSSGAGTIRMNLAVSLGDGRVVRQTHFLAGFSPPGEVGGQVARLVGLLHGNPFQPVTLTAVEVNATVESAIEAAFLERVEVAPGPWHPGDLVEVVARFRDYRGDNWSHRSSIRIPPTATPGSLTLEVADGAAALRLELERAPGVYQPRSFEQLFRVLGQETPYDALVLRLLEAEPQPVVEGRELPNLPGSLKRVLASPYASARATVAQRSLLATREERLGKLLLGSRALTLKVVAGP